MRRIDRTGLVHAALLAAVATVGIAANTDFHAPPRFDGAVYADLALAIGERRGYRLASHPDHPPHAHLPPGYPLAISALWRVFGTSEMSAHVFSAACTVGATLLAWRWFRGLFSEGVALGLGMALATNWTWGRIGGAFLSEPLFLLLAYGTIWIAEGARRRGTIASGFALGLALACCMLTRQVGACLALAVVFDLARTQRRAALAAGTTSALLVVPWAWWLLRVREDTQAGHFPLRGLGGLLGRNALFYLGRLPDALTGPFVEGATLFGRSAPAAALAHLWSGLATALLIWGAIRCLREPARRLAAMILLATLAVLLAWPFTEAGRFLIPLVPCLLVAATEGLTPIVARMGLRQPRVWASWALLAAAVPYSVYAIAAGRVEAARRSHVPFDDACAWITRQDGPPGPILARYPADVSWQTGRQALGPPGDPGETAGVIDRYHVAFLLVDRDRFANDPANPLSAFVAAHPGRVRQVFGGGGPVRIYVVEGR